MGNLQSVTVSNVRFGYPVILYLLVSGIQPLAGKNSSKQGTGYDSRLSENDRAATKKLTEGEFGRGSGPDHP